MARDRFAELLEHPTQAALVARCARAIFNFGIEHYRDDRTGESEIKQNPIEAFTKGVNKKMPKPRRRDNYLNNAQLPAWFEAIQNIRQQHCNVVDYLVVVLLLGGRRTEVARMKWVDVDLDQSMVAIRDTKNKRDHHLPLPAHVLEIFKRRREAATKTAVFAFPGESKMGYLTEPRYVMGKIVEITGVKFAMHDLRRTFATAADALDLNQRTIKRLMNHVDNQNDVTLGYIIHDVDRLREPMQKIEDYILIAGGVKNVNPAPPSGDGSATNV
jgi:integrase